MKAHDHLKALTADDWTAATNHAFADALAEGNLDIEKMRGYLEQDYLFIDGFVRLLATTIAHAPSLADSIPAAQFLAVITGPENTYFLRSFEALDCAVNASPASQTLEFQVLMEEARHSGRYELMLAVLCVAEGVYLEWATPFADRIDELPFWFGEWIALHCGEGFEGVVAYLRDQLNKAWVDLSEEQRADVEDIFKRAVKLEREFFDASWAGFPVVGKVAA
ncbi:MAG: TenA family protein [Pseudomonadota bacterium]